MWKFLPFEKLVILSLVEDATRTDGQVAEMNNINAGTVASVRRRMLDAGAIYYINVPSFHKLGCEMIAFSKGTLDPAVSAEIKTSDYMEFCSSSPQLFDAIISNQFIVFMSVLRNAADLEDLKVRHNRFFTGVKRVSKAKLSTTSFPYELSKGTWTTNFAPLVHRFFALDRPRPKPRSQISQEVTSPDLSNNEQKVLMALVENPSEPDRKVASIVGLSRQAVTRIRHKLLEQEYYTPICVPRLYRWGFEIYSVAHLHFNMDFALSEKYEQQPREYVDFSFFSLMKPDEAIANHMISTFQDYAHGLEAGLTWYHRERAFEKEPDMTLMSLEHCVEIKTFEFAPALRNLLTGKSVP
ncbi:MAG: hypothetical protein OEM29_03810 [Thermoplasmata archaeon]|nr:hypothetical protein [Thermoplasmata archaeon]